MKTAIFSGLAAGCVIGLMIFVKGFFPISEQPSIPSFLSPKEDPYLEKVRDVLDESRALCSAIERQTSPDTILRAASRVTDVISRVPKKVPDPIWREYRMVPSHIGTIDRCAYASENFLLLYWRAGSDSDSHASGRKALAEKLKEMKEANEKLAKLLGGL